MDPSSPKVRDTKQQIKNNSTASVLGNEALWMEIRDAVYKFFPEQNIKWRHEMHHQWRAPSKQHGIRRSHGSECRLKQQHVRDDRPGRPEPELFLLVFRTMNFDYF